MSSDIEGKSVHLNYEISVLNTKPKTKSVTCNFKIDENGNFVFDENLETPEFKYCGEYVDKANAGEVDFSQEIIDGCKPVILKYMESVKQSMLTYITLKESGIYPIKPEDTALKP